MLVNHSHLVLDACCVLNFCASGHLINILKSISAQVVVAEVVRSQELITLKRVEAGVNSDVDTFEGAVNRGLIEIEDFITESEQNDFINYAFQLGDDGESATFSIAKNRNWAVATDDKKAISFFNQEGHEIQLLSSLDVLKYYADKTQLTPVELKTLLGDVRCRGKYVANKNNPLRGWWEKSINLA